MAEMSTPIKLAVFVLFGVGFLVFLIGFAAPYWSVREWETPATRLTPVRLHVKQNYGLWRYCHETNPVNRGRGGYGAQRYYIDACVNMIDSDYVWDYIRATQFFETVGFLSAIVSLVLLLMGVCITSCRDKRILPILSAICAVAAAGCIILGCIIFGAKDAERPHLSWAFALAIVGGIFFGIAGVLIFVVTLVMKR